MASTDAPLAFRARWVFPIDRAPIEGGIVTIGGGRILAVGENASAGPPRDLGDVALLPGFVNAHTHLEFSLLDQPLGQRGMPFPAWIEAVVAYRRQRDKPLMVETDGFARFRRRWAEAGLKKLQEAATVAVGDIATMDWPDECAPARGLSLTAFTELLGLDPARQTALLARAKDHIEERLERGGIPKPGLGPHAPYTVGPDLLRKVCELSAAERVPVAMHLAESREELELLRTHQGPLVDVLARLGAWHPDSLPLGLAPIDYLQLLATAHRALVIHGNYFDRDEFEFLAAHRDRMSLVYCPRTHAYFGHDPYPLAGMLTAGAHVAVGTDSLASNPDLSILSELRHIARHHPNLSRDAILRMGTLSGAEALGLAEKLGSITPGKRALLATIPLEQTTGEPHDLLFGSSAPATLLSLS
jgi:cytosine/adenosine deaminase-related metal-dependent hydrolase